MAGAPGGDELRDRQELEAHVIQKAWSDPTFRQELISNPRATLQKELGAISPGAQIPETVEVVVHEESMTKIHLVLPVNPAKTELTDEELDLVAGGWGCGAKQCGCMYRSDAPREPAPCNLEIAPKVGLGG